MISVLMTNSLLWRQEMLFEAAAKEREVIGDVPLSTLMIPGTHNSGAYEVDESVRKMFKCF